MKAQRPHRGARIGRSTDVSPSAGSPRRAAFGAALLACSAAATAAPAGASTIVSGDCGLVAANGGSCRSAHASYSGNRRALFRYDGSGGVLHSAWLLDTVGQGTTKDVYSGCVLTGSSIQAGGQNNSGNAHSFHIYQVTGC